MNIFRFLLPAKNYGVLIRKFQYLTQSKFSQNSPGKTTKCLRKIAEHLLGLHPCSRIHSRSLCTSTSKEQFKDESKVQNNVVPEKDGRFTSKVYDNLPNESWSKETIRLYNELRKQADESNGLWVVPEFTAYTGEYNSFHTSVDTNGKKLFEFYRIVNKTDKLFKGVCQFGPWTMGPKGYVHGGAIAGILDVFTAGLPNRIGLRSVTAKLAVDFKLPVPVGSTVLIEGKIESIEGRKIYINGEMKSSDGLQLYATVKTLCVAPNANQ